MYFLPTRRFSKAIGPGNLKRREGSQYIRVSNDVLMGHMYNTQVGEFFECIHVGRSCWRCGMVNPHAQHTSTRCSQIYSTTPWAMKYPVDNREKLKVLELHAAVVGPAEELPLGNSTNALTAFLLRHMVSQR